MGVLAVVNHRGKYRNGEGEQREHSSDSKERNRDGRDKSFISPPVFFLLSALLPAVGQQVPRLKTTREGKKRKGEWSAESPGQPLVT